VVLTWSAAPAIAILTSHQRRRGWRLWYLRAVCGVLLTAWNMYSLHGSTTHWTMWFPYIPIIAIALAGMADRLSRALSPDTFSKRELTGSVVVTASLSYHIFTWKTAMITFVFVLMSAHTLKMYRDMRRQMNGWGVSTHLNQPTMRLVYLTDFLCGCDVQAKIEELEKHPNEIFMDQVIPDTTINSGASSMSHDKQLRIARIRYRHGVDMVRTCHRAGVMVLIFWIILLLSLRPPMIREVDEQMLLNRLQGDPSPPQHKRGYPVCDMRWGARDESSPYSWINGGSIRIGTNTGSGGNGNSNNDAASGTTIGTEVDIVDLALFAKLGGSPAETRDIMMPRWIDMSLWQAMNHSEINPLTSVSFSEFTCRSCNLTVIAIRGTSNFMDMIQNIITWGEAVVLAWLPPVLEPIVQPLIAYLAKIDEIYQLAYYYLYVHATHIPRFFTF
jgi:hypothetical protein